jgi:hypothetical protein
MTEQRARIFLPINLLIAIIAVSTASLFIRFAQAEAVPSLVIAAIRLTIAIAILASIAFLVLNSWTQPAYWLSPN